MTSTLLRICTPNVRKQTNRHVTDSTVLLQSWFLNTPLSQSPHSALGAAEPLCPLQLKDFVATMVFDLREDRK